MTQKLLIITIIAKARETMMKNQKNNYIQKKKSVVININIIRRKEYSTSMYRTLEY